jgi:hypothetical protein
MRHPLRAFRLLGFVLLSGAAACGASTGAWVRPGEDGRLIYRTDDQGNAVPDFSRAGYSGGGVRLPELPVVVTLTPNPQGDDSARIKAALDEVERRILQFLNFTS